MSIIHETLARPRPLQAPGARRRLLLGAAGLAPALLAGCSPLGSPVPRAWYRLDDLAPADARPPAAAPIPRVLLVETVSSGSLYEASALVFARTAGAFAHYRFASWSEPPVHRVGALLERRLGQRGRFKAVGLSTSGLRADLLLRVGLDALFHDAAAEPGSARVALDAELIDWRMRARIARRGFAAEAVLKQPDAQGAALAMSEALTGLLDQLAPWAEAAAAG